MRTRYPRTPHLPWSEGATPDDVRADTTACFDGRDVVVTEKLDGENTTLYRDALHARSLDSAHHPSRAWIKAYHERVRGQIPDGVRVSGENLFAKHALAYTDLESWFYLFSVWEGDHCHDWDATVAFGARIGAPTPRVLYRGPFDEKKIRALPLDRSRQEGYVVRTAEGFAYTDFASHVAKFVRKDHVTTDVHWARAPVLENGRSPRALLWDVRGGVRANATDLARVLGLEAPSLAGREPHAPAEARIAATEDALDAIGRFGDARLEGVIAALLAPLPRADVAPLLLPRLGARLARRISDLVGLARALREPFPDELRAGGLRSMARAADLGVLHALAGATTKPGVEADLVRWSELVASDAGLLSTAPLAALRAGARASFAALPPRRAQRAWSAALELWVDGKIRSVDEAIATTHAAQREDRASVVLMVGPSGSGKSTLTRATFADHAVISLDDRREARGERGDQSENAAVLTRALGDLGALLDAGRQVVWDATSLVRAQRRLVLDAARRRGALGSLVVFARAPAELARRNAARPHPVPVAVLEQQLHRFTPPYPGEADRVLYVGADDAITDTAGDLFTDVLETDTP
ncbi:MAG: RNA ligase family protein [Polyangiaceae bacterium]